MIRAIDQSTARCSGDATVGAKVDRANTARFRLDCQMSDIDGHAERLAPFRATLDIKSCTVCLAPGKSASAEITADRRRLLEYLSLPILRHDRVTGRKTRPDGSRYDD